ncbi:hypothetical protein J2R96_005034 [Bradyrhizobium elkanii]|nr:hypothetical protein [Bradyrhizobium elkanii]
MTTEAFEDYGEHAATAAAQTVSGRRRILIAGTIGTAIEWYDFFIYGLIAPLVFDQLFFPKFDQLTATIAVFATFAVGFLARPLGGIVFGHFGDRLGRKSVLLWGGTRPLRPARCSSGAIRSRRRSRAARPPRRSPMPTLRWGRRPPRLRRGRHSARTRGALCS